MKDGWVLSLVVMVMGSCAMEWTLRVCRFHNILTDHFPVVGPQPVLILVMILIQFDHRELLLQRASPVLLRYGPCVVHVLISALIMRRSLDHLTVVCTMLFRVGLVTSGRIGKSHGALPVGVATIHIGVTVSIDHLVPIDEDQVSRMRLLDAFRERLLLAPKGDLLVNPGGALTSTQGCLNDILLLLKAACVVHTNGVVRVARA